MGCSASTQQAPDHHSDGGRSEAGDLDIDRWDDVVTPATMSHEALTGRPFAVVEHTATVDPRVVFDSWSGRIDSAFQRHMGDSALLRSGGASTSPPATQLALDLDRLVAIRESCSASRLRPVRCSPCPVCRRCVRGTSLSANGCPRCSTAGKGRPATEHSAFACSINPVMFPLASADDEIPAVQWAVYRHDRCVRDDTGTRHEALRVPPPVETSDEREALCVAQVLMDSMRTGSVALWADVDRALTLPRSAALLQRVGSIPLLICDVPRPSAFSSYLF